MDEGLKILIDAYWCSKGWKEGTVSKDNFEIAKKEGYMFDYPKAMTHKETLAKAKKIIQKIELKDVVNAFLYSLSTRKLEYRSALATYYYILSIPNHESTDNNNCYICNWYSFKQNPNEYELKKGLNVFNFERYKWGGVRHDYLDYAVFDLENFNTLPKVTPSDEDIKILKRLLKTAEELEPNDKAGALLKAIQKHKIVSSNKSELQILLGILGMCDVLSSKEHPGYISGFRNVYERAPLGKR